jgi:ethylbenzene dioxygenase beta subunit
MSVAAMNDAKLPPVSAPFARLEEPVGRSVLYEVERFYFAEARALDAENYQGWLDRFLAPDIHYWMPDMDTRRRDDPRGQYAFGEAAYFDDGPEELRIRVARYNEPSAWADNPATRHVHLIANIEAFAGTAPDSIGAFSVFTNVRNRNETDQDVIHGRREDLLVRSGDELRIARRRILVVQNVLLSKNLNTFF